LQKIYETVKPLTRGKIIAVFGACGDRDKSKRPIMGAIAGRNADLIFVTNEDPYTEDPMEIINQVAVGIPRGRKDKKLKLDSDYFKILDRRVAIEKALNAAKKEDLVLITGKGAEKAMVVGDQKIPFDDREVVREILRKNAK
jgi:UDP-N-acetylmuramyl tripeptide synthase